jgi:hypothetical protein
MYAQGQARLAGFLLFLDQLLIPGSAAVLCRQRLLEKVVQIAVKIIHFFAGELVLTADVMEMQAQAGGVERATAVSRFENAVVAVRGKRRYSTTRTPSGQSTRTRVSPRARGV